jgi:hypothetical protein
LILGVGWVALLISPSFLELLMKETAKLKPPESMLHEEWYCHSYLGYLSLWNSVA